MANIEDYLDWRGDIPFSVDPFNEVDNLILAELAYSPFYGYVAGPDLKTEVPISEVCRRFFEDHTDEEIMSSNMSIKVAPFLMRKMVVSTRFKDIRLTGFVDEYDEKTEMQFSVTTFLLPDNTYYVAYRGTDDTIVGWKEDFNMAFMYQTPGQMRAVKYLNDNFRKGHKKLRVGGHSKGANFAVFASAFADTSVKKKIINVYSNDGPGFREAVTNTEEYKSILPILISTVPEQSVIGMIFDNNIEHQVVKSTNTGAYQHDAMSWCVKGNHFEYATKLSEQSHFFYDTLQTWLYGLDDGTRKIFVDNLFEGVLSSGVGSINNISEYKGAIVKAIGESLTHMSREDQKVCRDVLKKLAVSGGETVVNNIKSKYSLPELKTPFGEK